MRYRRSAPILILLGILIIRLLFCPSISSTPNHEIKILTKFNDLLKSRTYAVIPEIQANLLLGMTIGTDDIKKDKEFYDKLIKIGLVHVVVVSGYNISLVLNILRKVFFDKLSGKNRFVILGALVLYAFICGLQPPVIRASLMGYVGYLALAEGRGIATLNLLAVVCIFTIILFPDFILSLSFWLSTGSTLGLIVFGSGINRLVESRLTKVRKNVLGKLIPIGDFATSISCQIVVWPLISHFFGRVSLFSPIYNMCILWIIPICTIAGFIFIPILLFAPLLAKFLMYLIYPLFDLFVKAVELFSAIDPGSMEFKIGGKFMFGYYLLLFILVYKFRHVIRKCTRDIKSEQK